MDAVCLLATLLIGAATSAGATSLRVDEFDIGRFNFCDSHKANLGLLARVEDQVEQAHPSVKAWEQANLDLVREGIALASDLVEKADCRVVFDVGREIFREETASAFAVVKQNETYEKTADEDVRRARLDLMAQWIQEEANRRVLARLRKDSQDPAMQWARAQGNTRMKHVASNSAAVISLVYEEFGVPEPATLGPRSAWQAAQLAERYGVPAGLLQSSLQDARLVR